jgi:nucleoside-diphosphate-sugar epimerase
MKVLLTGANGFVGSHVLDRLCAKGIPTVIMLRPGANARFIKKHIGQVEVRLGSLNDPPSLEKAMRDVTHVIHSAGCVKALQLREFYEVNQAGTRSVVNAINQQQGRVQRLVHISSMAAGGPATSSKPASEDDPPQPVSEYGKSKLAGEQEIRNNCRAPFVILRPPSVYGPRDFEFLRLFKAIKLHLRPRIGGGRQALSFAYVEDLAEVIVACLDTRAVAGRTYYVAGSEVVTSRGLAEEIAAQMNTWTIPLPLPTAALWPMCCLQEAASRLTGSPNVLNRQKYPELRAEGWVCNPARLAQEAGLTCATTLKKGLMETLAWYQKEGCL